MAIQFVALTCRSKRRIRLSFSQTLAAGAYSPGLYQVTSTDSIGSSPGVNAALLVPNSPDTVELALAADLADDANYLVNVTTVPGVDASTVTGSLTMHTPGSPLSPSPVLDVGYLDALLYGTDIVWNGVDFVESANGDLATISGIDNVTGALERLPTADGLLWDPGYSPKLREYVDAPSASLPQARGALERAYLRDDRVTRVTVSIDALSTPGQVRLSATPVLLGDVRLNVQQDVQPNPDN